MQTVITKADTTGHDDPTTITTTDDYGVPAKGGPSASHTQSMIVVSVDPIVFVVCALRDR